MKIINLEEYRKQKVEKEIKKITKEIDYEIVKALVFGKEGEENEK